MKNRIYLFAATLALTFGATCCMDTIGSGSGDETLIEISDNDVCFRVSDNGTKAFSETTTENLKGKGFNAVVFKGDATYIPQGAATWNSAKNVYLFPSTYYYPLTGSLDVYACQPRTMDVVGTSVSVSFTQATASYEEDLIASHAFASMPKSGAVPLTFSHLLAQVTTKFKAGDSKADYYVKSCVLTSPSGGTYSINSSKWTPSAVEAHRTFGDEGGVQASSEGTSLGGTVTCVPCTLKVKVNWECREKTLGTTVATYEKTGDIIIVQGKRNKITITLTNNDAEELELYATVTPWEEGTEEDLTWLPVHATYSVSPAATSVTLPKAVLAADSEGAVDWGDGDWETFTNATKSALVNDTLTLSHTYSSAYTGEVMIGMMKGSLDFRGVEADEFKKFTVIDGSKITVAEKSLLLPGIFTVSTSGKKVKFAKGNLMANVNAEGTAVIEWKLAEHQYDYVGNTTAQQQCKGGWVDLFGWTPEGKYSDGVKQYGINTSDNDDDYIKNGKTDTCCDWGNLIDDDMTMLSESEWQYLVDNNRYVGKSITVAGVGGCILKPDGFSGTVSDSYTAAEWTVAEASGLVFIPFAGYREHSDVLGDGHNGNYWSSTPYGYNTYEAYYAFFKNDRTFVDSFFRYYGHSVRLVSVQ